MDRAKILGLIAAAGLVIAACGGTTPAASPTAAAPTQAQAKPTAAAPTQAQAKPTATAPSG
ncbi:MAG: hypothetical protein FJ028_05530, partial [Chloroflexi bacterium]|nr:hypothetical protein [Chloroflexota bacterium]